MRWKTGDWLTVKKEPSGCWLVDPTQDVKERCLARSIRSNQGMYSVAPDCKLDFVHCLETAEVFREVVNFKDGQIVFARYLGGERQRRDPTDRHHCRWPQPLPERFKKAPDTFGHEDHEQDDRSTINRKICGLQEAKPLGQQDEKCRTKCGAKR